MGMACRWARAVPYLERPVNVPIKVHVIEQHTALCRSPEVRDISPAGWLSILMSPPEIAGKVRVLAPMGD